ncbi:MAG: hypothetical protein FJZ90_14825, partial [Chloroflexi bacterium]|nr:hypothetical protein [Chloroflexota bacterium]
MRTQRSSLVIGLSVALCLLLTACGPDAQAPTPTSEALSITVVRTPKPTFTPLPKAAPSESQATPREQGGSGASAPTVTEPPPTETQAPAPTATEASPTRTVRSARMKSPEYGMQAFLWWRPEVASRDLQLIRDAGFGWCKVNFGWRDIEGAGKGVYDWSRTDRIVQQAEEVGVDLVVRVDHQPAWSGGGFPTNGPPDNPRDLADFLTALAHRYRGRIRAYEVWNEPNLAREWGGKLPDPTAYVNLLRMSYAALKAGDPEAMVISAGLSPTGTWDDQTRPDDWYLETMYVVMGGNSRGVFDVVGAHGAGYKSPPERDPAEVAANPDLGGHRSLCFRRIEDLRAIMVKYGDANKQIALLEFGWTSDPRPSSPYNWHAVSEQTKAEYFVRAYQYAKKNWSPWIGLMSLIYIADHDWTENDEQYWWAITYPGYP